MSGTLYIVSTPIGNLKDITSRSLEVLENVDLIAAEDTRITKRLLNHFDIKNNFISYNDYNENKKYQYLLDVLKDNKNVAIVSDAGTPCISDPGYRIVNAANLLGFPVVTIPGPSSAIAALSISGLPSDSFYFEGFLPKKKGRTKRLNYLKDLDCTVIIFESPKRLLKISNDIFAVESDLMDDIGGIGIAGLFIPEQWSMPPHIDKYGNSLIKESLRIHCNQRIFKTQIMPFFY